MGDRKKRWRRSAARRGGHTKRLELRGTRKGYTQSKQDPTLATQAGPQTPHALHGEDEREKWPQIIQTYYAAKYSNPTHHAEAKTVLARLSNVTDANRLERGLPQTPGNKDVLQTIDALKNAASPGMDGIPGGLLKTLPTEWKRKMHAAFTSRLRGLQEHSNRVEGWSRVKVMLLPKPGKPLTAFCVSLHSVQSCLHMTNGRNVHVQID